MAIGSAFIVPFWPVLYLVRGQGELPHGWTVVLRGSRDGVAQPIMEHRALDCRLHEKCYRLIIVQMPAVDSGISTGAQIAGDKKMIVST